MKPIRIHGNGNGQHRSTVMVGYPVGGSVTLGFHASMLKLLGYEIAKGDDRLLAKIGHSQSLYVASNRTMLANRLLESSADWLLQLDTDIEFPPTLLETLLATAGERKILAASVPLGVDPTCAYRLTDKPGVWDAVASVTTQPMIVDGVATAAFLCHREVFETIAREHGRCWFHHMYLPRSPEGTAPESFEYIEVGEDLAFCLRAKRAGYDIWCAHVPGLKHHKSRALSHDNEYAQALAAADSGVGELVAEG